MVEEGNPAKSTQGYVVPAGTKVQNVPVILNLRIKRGRDTPAGLHSLECKLRILFFLK